MVIEDTELGEFDTDSPTFEQDIESAILDLHKTMDTEENSDDRLSDEMQSSESEKGKL